MGRRLAARLTLAAAFILALLATMATTGAMAPWQPVDLPASRVTSESQAQAWARNATVAPQAGALTWTGTTETGAGAVVGLTQPRTEPVTLISRFAVAGQGTLRLWLAGLAPGLGVPPTDLALTLVGTHSGWFGFTGSLRLESASGRLPAALRPRPETTPAGPSEYLELVPNLALTPGELYEATLAYHPQSGLTSVRLVELPSGHPLYEGHLHVRPVQRPLYPATGALADENPRANDTDTWQWQLHHFLVQTGAPRLGLPIGLQGGVRLTASPKPAADGPPAAAAAAPHTVLYDQALTVSWDGLGVGLPGHLRLVALPAVPAPGEGTEPHNGDVNEASATAAPRTMPGPVELWQGEPSPNGQVTLPAHRLPPGRYRLTLFYEEPDAQWEIAQVDAAVVAARVEARLRLDGGGVGLPGDRLEGELVLRADRALARLTLRLTAAPTSRPAEATLLWEQTVALQPDRALTLPVAVTLPRLQGVPVFQLVHQSPQEVEFVPAYSIPRTYYVSPDGDDRWSGRFPSPVTPSEGPESGPTDGPFRTLARAQQAIRALRSAGALQGPVTIYVRGGVYRLTEPLRFTPEDSGTSAAPITFAAYPGEEPVISGGRPITGWQRRDDHLWAAPVPEAVGGRWSFRTLRVGDAWAIRARYPNYDPEHPHTGGWLFAQWWGQPWERGAFNSAVGNIHNPGDRLEWIIQVPASGTYRVFVRYAHQMQAYGVPTMDGRTTLRAGDGPPVPLRHLPDTGGWGAYRWSEAATLQLQQGEQTLIWENVQGGGLNLDAFFLTDDPAWQPETGLANDPTQYPAWKVAPGRHGLLIQAEAVTRAVGPEVTVPQTPAPSTGLLDRITLAPGTFPDWPDWTGAELHLFPAWGWVNAIVPVTGVDPSRRTLYVRSQQDIRPGSRFFIANVREALDSPGEWFLDTRRGELLYWPKEADFPHVEVVAPTLDRLVELRGDATGRFVEHLTFRGLTFTDTDYTAPGGYYSHADAAIWLSAARHIRIEACTFVRLGGYAVRLEQGSHDNAIVANRMAHLGQGGVIMLGETADQPHHNLVAANDMHDLGYVYKHVAGVYVTTGSDNRIVHNRIQRVPRYGISLKSYSPQASSHRNIVEYNELLDTNLETNDTGAIETLGRDQAISGNVIRFNLIRNVVGLATTPDGQFLSPYFTWGIYLDDYSSGTTVYGNIVVGTVLGALCIHGGKENVVENNIFIDGSQRQITLQPRDAFMQGNVFRRNIVVYSQPRAVLWYAWANQWHPGRMAEVDHNLYWHTGGLDLQASPNLTPEGHFGRWQAAGFDRHSLIADPLFVDPATGNLQLRPESPAWQLGFQPIPVERIGPQGYRDPEP